MKISFDGPPVTPVRLELDSTPVRTTGQPDKAGYAVVVNPAARTVEAYVRTEIDPIRLDGLPAIDLPAPDPDGWAIQRMTVNRSFLIKGTPAPAEFIEVGRLIEGIWDTQAPDYNSMATWSLVGTELDIRLPWSMLGMGDPSSHIGVVPGINNVPTSVQVDNIPMTIDMGSGPVAVGQIAWDPWQQAQAVERLKPDAHLLKLAFEETAD